MYEDLGKDLLAIPFLTGEKTEHERFAGAVHTYTIEALMHDGKTLHSGTSHYLGQGFAKAFGISYLGHENKLEAPHQTSWGVSTRLLGAVIMVHGDDNGLVLPPRIAPIQVVIIPIRMQTPGVLEACRKMVEVLKGEGVRVYLDDDDSKTPGWKFAQYEMKGVPLRIEVGPRDLEKGEAVLTRRVDGLKQTAKIEEIEKEIPGVLEEIHEAMYQKALANLNAHIYEVSSVEELQKTLDEHGGFAKMPFCGDPECEDRLKEMTGGISTRCIAPDHVHEGTKCPCCGKEAKMVVYFGKAY